jgi:hypothetical protein
MPTLIRRGMIALGALGVAGGVASSGACGGGGRPAAPAAVPAATPGDTAGLRRVRFARGTSSGIVSDSLRAGESRGYLLGAEQGQVMLAHAITWPARESGAPAAAATVRVFSVAEEMELTARSGLGPLWSGRMPATGDYVVRVSATQPTAYTLAVQIPRRLSVGEGDPTAAIAGTAPSRAPVDYLIAGRSGQTLAASVRDDDPATLHLYGLDDGAQLAPLAERRRLWAGTLPASQDYVISVVPAGEGASYQLTVAVR